MKPKTINSIIRRKVDDLFKHHPGIKEILADSVIVTGGCIPSMLLRENVNDFDIYFTDRQSVVYAANYFLELFKSNPTPKFKSGDKVDISLDTREPDRVKVVVKSAGIASEEGKGSYQYFEQLDPSSEDAEQYAETVSSVLGHEKAKEEEEKDKYRPIFLSSNAITLSDKVQIVLRFWGSADTIHENYDFAHCTNYWTYDSGLVLRQNALESLLAKDLKYIGSKYPLCSIIRTRKFIQRGWTCTAGQILKMCMQLNELNLEDMKVLEDQLTGVDMAYFQQLLRLVKEKNPDKVDVSYLMQIIDRIM